MIKKILAFGFLFIMFFVFGNSVPNTVFAESANITQINFTNSPQAINIDEISAIMTVQTQDTGGAEEKTSSVDEGGTPTSLNLSSTSATGIFYNANASNCTTELIAPFK